MDCGDIFGEVRYTFKCETGADFDIRKTGRPEKKKKEDWRVRVVVEKGDCRVLTGIGEFCMQFIESLARECVCARWASTRRLCLSPTKMESAGDQL